MRIAVVGGGIAGLTATWQIARLRADGADVKATLFESSGRLGGIVETVHREGFTIECGPDGWVTEKPWARTLALELDLEDELLASNDSTRKTHILLDGRLETMPDGMRLMVPSELRLVDDSRLFSPEAKRAFHEELARAEELRERALHEDESVASFTRRHFGEEVLARIAAPLLSGVLGGDVETLSVQAVMPQFVAMEREYGSLIAALQARPAGAGGAIFTTLRSGLGTLVARLEQGVPRSWLRMRTPVAEVFRDGDGWRLRIADGGVTESFDGVMMAASPRVTRDLLRPLDSVAADLVEVRASSAIVVALGYRKGTALQLPQGFGFLVPAAAGNQLLACTFVDQKFAGRVPEGGRLLRAFFGAEAAEGLLGRSDEELQALAVEELRSILGTLPEPDLVEVRRWPRSLPQYGVGHLGRVAELERRIAEMPGVWLLGNAYRGVGLPDLIRQARAVSRRAAGVD